MDEGLQHANKSLTMCSQYAQRDLRNSQKDTLVTSDT